jgi:hypothetical protein
MERKELARNQKILWEKEETGDSLFTDLYKMGTMLQVHCVLYFYIFLNIINSGKHLNYTRIFCTDATT